MKSELVRGELLILNTELDIQCGHFKSENKCFISQWNVSLQGMTIMGYQGGI